MQNLLLSTAAFLLAAPVSVAAPSFDTHTHTDTPVELKSISLPSDSIKTASVCFLGFGNCGENQAFKKGDDYTVDTAKQCKNEGFTITSCSLPGYPFNQCPYNQNYYASCKEDKARACREAGYVSSCGTGYVQDSLQTCPYSSSYFKCKCSPCDGYGYTYAQATAQGYVTDGSCKTCSTTKYKRKINPCIGYNSCECGGQIGTAICYSGTAVKYQACKTCCAFECTLPSCPSGYTCRYEACSGKYCKTGCAVNYTDWCTQPVTDCGTLGYTKTVSQCPDGYLKCPYGDTVFCPNIPMCAIGDIYYSDNSCSSAADYNNAKTALGVVIHVTEGGRHGQVISPWPIDADGNKSLRGFYMNWFTDYSPTLQLPRYDSNREAVKDFDSCGNTMKIISAGGVFPAARATRQYAPTVKTEGKWCLPAAGIMNNFYNNQDKITMAISKAGGFYNTSEYIWTSTLSFSYAWAFHVNYDYGLTASFYMGDAYMVRPVLEF